MRGNMEIGVNPGMVFTSLRTRPPSGLSASVRKKSTRARPAQSSAVNARQASSCTRWATASGSRAGTSNSHASSRYFDSKSYQSCPPTSRISAGTLASGGPPRSPSSTPHSTSRPATADSTSTFGSTSRAAATAASNSDQSATLLMPMLDPALAGLTNTGSPSRSRSSAGSEPVPGRSTAVPASTCGSVRPAIRSASGSPLVSTQAPFAVMPTGTTSYRSRSSAASTLPADTQEMACSGLRPPKTTATRIRRSGMRGTLALRHGDQRCVYVRDQIGGVLAAGGQPDKARRNDVPAPASAPVGGGVQAAEAGGVADQSGRAEERRDR